jgi:hypothetical protein
MYVIPLEFSTNTIRPLASLGPYTNIIDNNRIITILTRRLLVKKS